MASRNHLPEERALEIRRQAIWELFLTAAEDGQLMKMVQGLETVDIWGVLPLC